MSEEINNEDNCVLDKGDLSIIQGVFEDCVVKHEEFWKKYKITMKFIPDYMPELFQKINKLNDIAKNTNKTGLSDKNDNSIFLDHICRDIDGKLFRVDYHAAAYWANYQYRRWELLGNVTEQCEIITTYEEDCKSKNPIWKPPFKKLTKTIGGKNEIKKT